jgi:nucleoside-diphosphate-sugar epimerase
LTGPLEETNEWYAIAKIAGIKLCMAYRREYAKDFISLMPTNLYGPGDNYHPENSHVIPALIRRFHEAKQAGATTVQIWGSGAARREFLYVDDMADACLHVMGLPKVLYDRETMPMRSHLNVGSDSDISILDLARIISEVIGFEGIIETDPSKPDGAPRKLMDSKRMHALG